MTPTSLLKPEIKEWFFKSIGKELYASNLYKHIANYMQRIGMRGAQKYFIKESYDEQTHYQKIVDFVNDMGDVLSVPGIPAMEDKIMNVSDAIEVAYETELELLKHYQDFYEEAEDKYDDCPTYVFLMEFIQIQRKSVGEYGDLLARLQLNPSNLFEFDEYLGELAE